MASSPTLGAPDYVYQAGRASQGFLFPLPQVQTATLEAMADLGIHDREAAGINRSRSLQKMSRAQLLPIGNGRRFSHGQRE